MAKSTRHLELEQRIHELEKLLSEKQQTEKEAHPFEDNFKAVFEAANVGKSVTLPDGTINVNKAFADMLGYSQVELESTTWQSLTPADEIERIQKIMIPVISGESDSTRFDKRYIHKNGSHIWVDVSVSAHRDSQGDLLHFITTVVNITDRKRAEEDLMKSESNLSALINAREESIWSIDKHYNFDILNDYFKTDFLKAFGIELKSGMSAVDILSPELRNVWLPLYTRAMKGEHVVFEFSNPIAKKLHSFEATLHPIYTNGIISGVSVITVNNTERKQAEHALIENSANMTAVMENTRDSIWTINTVYEIVFVNSIFAKSFHESFGVHLKLGVSLLGSLPKPIQPVWKERYDRVLAGESFEVVDEIDVGTHNIYIEVSFNPITVNDKIVGASFFGRDITHRKQAEVALQESEERFRILSAFTNEGIMIHREGIILDVNSAFCDLIGYENPKDLIGYKGMKMIPFTPESAKKIKAHLRSGSTEFYDIELQGRDGQIIPAETMGTNISYMGQEARLTRMRDISERKQAEKERLVMEQQLLQTQKLESLGVLAGGIAHDFNNILMGILGYADLALSELDTFNPAREYVQGINDSSRKAADLVKQMLAYSGKGKFSLEPIDLNHLIQDTVQMLTISISKNVVLKFNYSDEPGYLEGDPSQIRQIIMNMVINASEAIGKKSGVIALTTGAMYCDRDYIDGTGFEAQLTLREQIAEGMYLFLEVSDTGTGIDKATIDRIFEPFFTTKYTGRGLGLSAVLGIVRGHKGLIKIYSEETKGTSFKVLFPLHGSQVDTLQTETAMELEDKWQGEGTFLIADDEEAVRTVGKHMIKKLGFEVLTADDGRMAIELFKKNSDRIVGVLLDLTMPHKDGAQVFQEIRRIKPEVKVILSSGYNEQDATQEFVGKGLAGFIQKPYVAKELVAKVKEVFTRSKNN